MLYINTVYPTPPRLAEPGQQQFRLSFLIPYMICKTRRMPEPWAVEGNDPVAISQSVNHTAHGEVVEHAAVSMGEHNRIAGAGRSLPV